MKTISRFMLLVAIMIVGFGCEHGPDTPPDTPPSGVPGIEIVAGVISNEDGEVLAGIQVDVYYDEGLTHHYNAEEWNAWNALTDKEQIEYAHHNPIRYTDKEGHYQFAKDPRYVEKPIDIYVVATDTAGIYETQVQHGQIEYWKSPIWADGHQDSSGSATVNVVLKKKQ